MELERARIGTHVRAVRGNLPASARGTVLRGAQLAGLLGLLEKHPIERLEFPSELADEFGEYLGEYEPVSRTVRLNAGRGPGTYGQPFMPGRMHTVSESSPSLAQALQRSFVHELGHHLLALAARRLGSAEPEERLRRALALGRPVSLRAGTGWKEYFCETQVAIVFHRVATLDYDPVGVRELVRLRELLEVETP